MGFDNEFYRETESELSGLGCELTKTNSADVCQAFLLECGRAVAHPETVLLAHLRVAETLSHTRLQHERSQELWQWLRQRATMANDDEKYAMFIAWFEVVGEPPVHEAHLDELFEFFRDVTSVWAVYAAFHRQPDWPGTVREQYLQYTERCARAGRPIAPFRELPAGAWIPPPEGAR